MGRAKTKKGSDARPNDNDACHDLRLAFPSINGASAEHNVCSFFKNWSNDVNIDS